MTFLLDGPYLGEADVRFPSLHHSPPSLVILFFPSNLGPQSPHPSCHSFPSFFSFSRHPFSNTFTPFTILSQVFAARNSLTKPDKFPLPLPPPPFSTELGIRPAVRPALLRAYPLPHHHREHPRPPPSTISSDVRVDSLLCFFICTLKNHIWVAYQLNTGPGSTHLDSSKPGPPVCETTRSRSKQTLDPQPLVLPCMFPAIQQSLSFLHCETGHVHTGQNSRGFPGQ